MKKTYLQSLNEALFEIFEVDERVFLIGEDLLDPYGGAFKVSKGLSSRFPHRVITTPISEACFVGIGAGMALRGLIPIIEIMFGDFITLAADQIINHVAKFPQMYNKNIQTHVVIRTPMGGGRGYGPTHSQSLEKIFLGIPGLRIVAPSHFQDPGQLLKKVVLSENDPVIFIESKRLYPHHLRIESDDILSVTQENGPHGYPAALVKNFNTGVPDLLILSYGGLSNIIEGLLLKMHREEINILCYFPSLISELSAHTISDLANQCGRIIIVEEGAGPFGWSAEVATQIYENASSALIRPIKRITALDSIIPASKQLEDHVLPNSHLIESAMEEML